MTELAAAIRFVHLAAAVFLAGSFAFLVVIARPVFRRAGGTAGAADSLCLTRHRRAACWSLSALLATALAALGVQAVIVSDPGAGAGSAGSDHFAPQTVIPLLTQTLYGKVWLLRFALVLSVAALLLPGGTRRAQPPASSTLGLALSACLLASIAFSGHAAAGEAWQFALQICADGLHLLAAGAWLGGLLPLILLLRHCQSAEAWDVNESAPELIRAVTWRYSRLGIACVVTLMITGGINAWVLVGGVPQLIGTPYGRLLLLKLALLLPLLGLAAVNLLKINPGIAGNPAARPDTLPKLSKKLARNAMIETGLGILVLLIAAMLGTTPPAVHAQPDWPLAFRWDWSVLDAEPQARAEFGIGFAWGVLGLFVLQFAFLSRHWRMWSATAGTALILYAGTVIVAPVTIDAYPTTYRRPEVAYHAISVANGKQLYGRHCLACHGASGHGDGPAAASLRPRPADLNGRRANAHTAGDLFWWLSNGIHDTAMAGFNASLAEDERWDLINYVRALAGGSKARKLAPVIDAEAWLVAPDFVYATANGESRALKDHRGATPVLLVLLDSQNAAVRLAQLDEAASQLKDAGVATLIVARDPRGSLQASPPRLPLVSEGNNEIHETYALFAGSFSGETPGAAAAHVEYLIDKQGYIRARWLPADGDAWRDPAAIVRQAELLRKETPRAPAPVKHVH